jgi:hypothetical protein
VPYDLPGRLACAVRKIESAFLSNLASLTF